MDPQIWIPLTIAGLALLALAAGSWLEERRRIKRLPPGAFVDWHDD